MFKIDTIDAVSSAPTPAAAGTPGYFQDGNPNTATVGTLITADWLNGVQDTLTIPITAAGLSLSKTVHTQLSTVINGVKGTTLASAATVALGAAQGTFIDISGTTTITAFDSVQAGRRIIVRFLAALTLTHNATSLILPTAANITTAANDTATFISLGSGNWICTSYQKASGQSLINTVYIKSIVRQVFTASGTYTPTTGMAYAEVELVGGGGGGGGTGAALGSGGGAGGYARKLFLASAIGSSQTVTIGTGGAALTNGTTTSFGALMSATGGSAGVTLSSSVATQGGAGGTGVGGDINNVGSYGGIACAATGASFSGVGAASRLGQQSPALVSGSGTAGSNGYGYGSGGSGGWNSTPGSGIAGIVIVTEYCTQ